MCKAFSCLFTENGSVVWKWGVDSHEELISLIGARDDGRKQDFVRIEIPPRNGNYLSPDEWIFRVDQADTPSWFKGEYAEKMCRVEQKEWLKKLDKILVHKPIVHPFRDIKPPKRITKEHLDLLKKWDSVWDSVRDSVWDSVRDSVRASVGASVWASVRDSVWASVRDSVRDSVWAYVGSFFNLPRSAWKYTEQITGMGYPFQPVVDLWNIGLVPSFDGESWRLHGGGDGKVLWKEKKGKKGKKGKREKRRANV